MALADLKIAVTGAAGRSGQSVRTILADQRVPADKVRLLEGRASSARAGVEDGAEEAIISEYAGQATLIGTLEPEALADRDLVFLCGTEAESAGCLVWPRKRGSLFVDLSGASASRGEAPVVNLAVSKEGLSGPPATVAAPHALSYALSTLLAPLSREVGIASVHAVIHRPAADFGDAGLEELHKQTVSLLNFGEVPKQTYGRQIAFNLVPQTTLDGSVDGEPGLEARVESEIGRILGWAESRAAVRAVIVPVFHGHTGFVHVSLEKKTSARAVADLLKGVQGVSLSTSARSAPTPVEIAERSELLVGTLAPAGAEENGFWIWVAGGDLATHAARNAVDIGTAVLG